VNVLKVKWLLMIFLVITFSGGRMAMAHEGDQKMPSTSSLNGDGPSQHNMEGMDMSGSTKNDSMEGMDMGGHSHSDVQVEEKPANIKVLGTYGAVNLSFIIIGVWNKWFRRKDGSDGDSK
jgi:hypothetical protein